MTESSVHDADVLIIGAGPTGLSIANLLGLQDVSVIVLEQLDKLIDYPRGVGIDDESLRSLQTMGVVDKALPYTTPSHIMRLVNGKGELITEIRPATDEFGWSRRNAFIQPEVDRVLYEGLERFDGVNVYFDRTVTGFDQDDEGVTVYAKDSDGGEYTYRAKYVVGADGGRSEIRKSFERAGATFDGESPPTRWLVVDINNDPLGTPNIYLGGDPARPYVSLGLPMGIRRFEFMLFDDEPDDLVDDPSFLDRLLGSHVPDPQNLDIIRARVYTHHSRVASQFRKGRVLVAGDAAHLMPVWQGQGWNSGERDATNLAWKLGAVVNGLADDRLLDTYQEERKAHAKAMVDLSTAFGKVVKPTNKVVVTARDVAAKVLNKVAPVRDYFAQMRYKPMPFYQSGAVVDSATLRPGVSEAKHSNKLHVFRSASEKQSPVGKQFIQPEVVTEDGRTVLLDDELGYGWAVIEWGGNPETLFNEEQRRTLKKMGAKLVSVRPLVQMTTNLPSDPDAVVLGDVTGRLKQWFDQRPGAVVFLRPDRFIAAACVTQDAGRTAQALAKAIHMRPDAPERPVAPSKAAAKSSTEETAK